jgi:RNA polymerase sigma-70 factor (ECF subfamily)
LLGWLRRKLNCADHAADLAQDTFVRLLTLPAEKSSVNLREPRAYLTTVAQRLVIDHYRRQSLEQAWLDTLALMPEALTPAPEERLIILQTLHKVDLMLDGLPQRVRSTFLLSQLEGLGYAAIAARLNISERTVKRYMAQAFEQCILLIA